MAGTSSSGGRSESSMVEKTAPGAAKEPLCDDLNYNLEKIKEKFSYPQNVDFIIREIEIKALKRGAVILFMHGMVEDETLQRHIIVPLLERVPGEAFEDPGTAIMKQIITGKNLRKEKYFNEVTTSIVNGETVILIEHYGEAVSVMTTGYEARSVEQPTTENVLRGPKEAFNESERSNRSLVRKHLRYENLVTESVVLKSRMFTQVFIMYVKDIANPELIESVKRRINSVEADNVDVLGTLEEYIEDRPYSLISTTLMTERPDRTVSFLREGHAAIFMDGSPYALIAPITFWSIFHTAEDTYQRWFYGNFLRLIRIICIYIAWLTPGLYIAITNYHVDMIPTDLVLAISATREKLPFPALLEILIMEITFEILREAGIRIPSPIGPTIGIVGALILGQAAVQANVVSPILVIVVALTGLASFAIPENSLSFTIRIGRFILLVSGMFFGFFGLGACFTCSLAYASTVRSFGVPFFAPMAPRYKSSLDTVVRSPIWKMWRRPEFVKPRDKVRSKPPKRS